MKKPIEKFNNYLLSKVNIELATGQEVKSATESVEQNIRIANAILDDFLKLKTQWDNNSRLLNSDIYSKTLEDYSSKSKELGFDPNDNDNYKRLLKGIKESKDLYSKMSKYFK